MQRLEIRIFHFAEAVVKNLLSAAAAASVNDAGTFPQGLAQGDAIVIFCDLHEKTPFCFLYFAEKPAFYTGFGEICFVYFHLQKEMVIGNL